MVGPKHNMKRKRCDKGIFCSRWKWTRWDCSHCKKRRVRCTAKHPDDKELKKIEAGPCIRENCRMLNCCRWHPPQKEWDERVYNRRSTFITRCRRCRRYPRHCNCYHGCHPYIYPLGSGEGLRKSIRCQGVAATGQQCRRRVDRNNGIFCTTHKKPVKEYGE